MTQTAKQVKKILHCTPEEVIKWHNQLVYNRKFINAFSLDRPQKRLTRIQKYLLEDEKEAVSIYLKV